LGPSPGRHLHFSQFQTVAPGPSCTAASLSAKRADPKVSRPDAGPRINLWRKTRIAIQSKFSIKATITSQNEASATTLGKAQLMKTILIAACSLASLAATATTSVAASQVFLDRAAFLGVAGPVTVDPEAPSFGDFGITNGPSASAVVGNFSNAMPGNELALSGDENFNIAFSPTAFPDPVFSFGFDFIEPTGPNPPFAAANGCNVSICVDSTFEVTLLSSGSAIETLSFRPVDDSAQDQVVFFGFISDIAFDGIQVREIVGSNDNEMFQTFTVGTTALTTTPVPLPAPLVMLFAALGTLGLATRRRA
jgi:hypothetical protein